MADPSDDFASNLADVPGSLVDGRYTLVVIGAVGPTLLDLVSLAPTGQDTVVTYAGLYFDVDGDGASNSAADDDLVRFISHSPVESFNDGPVRLDVPMPPTCPACSLREVLIAVAQDRAAQDLGGTTTILLPAAIRLTHLLLGLAEGLIGTGVRLAGVVHVLDATTALDKFLKHRQLSAFPGDTRCTGVVHLINLGYAGLVLVLGRDEDPAGADLVEHLRFHDTLLLPGLDAPLLETPTTLTHGVVTSSSRIHPATTNAWDGLDEHGVQTLDLSTSPPFHPERLRSLVVGLASQGLCTRGCFWLPSCPGRVYTWEVAGGAVSVGDTDTWAKVPAAPSDTDDDMVGEPRNHLVIIGVGDRETREWVRRAFSWIPLRPEKMAQVLVRVGVGDDLGGWFRQED